MHQVMGVILPDYEIGDFIQTGFICHEYIILVEWRDFLFHNNPFIVILYGKNSGSSNMGYYTFG